MGIRLAMVGLGQFAQCFIPLFKAHPLVDEITLCDTDPEKLTHNAEKHGIDRTSPSLDHVLGTEVDAVALITQNWMHGPQAAEALRAGKHVYSAVPAGMDFDEIRALVRAVEETGRIYMMGETSYYYPGVIYCREQYRKGAFGRVVYSEAEYYHDWDHGLYEVMQKRGGADWKRFAGSPPMYYVTHSVGSVIPVTGAHMTHVSCVGFRDADEDGLYLTGANIWNNPFSNQSALFQMSDGSSCRINEFRRVGHPGTVRLAMFGTEGCFEDNCAGAVWVTKNRGETQRLDDLLRCGELPAGPSEMAHVTGSDGTHRDVSAVHPVERLPREFVGLPNGHNGSHQFLVDDFVKACVSGKTPPNNVWEAARYTIPGIIAHESAMRGGELLEIPDLGDPR